MSPYLLIGEWVILTSMDTNEDRQIVFCTHDRLKEGTAPDGSKRIFDSGENVPKHFHSTLSLTLNKVPSLTVFRVNL
ncbi:hypothetical protein C2W62_03925 [Candidatus Entotheonella serta]|nr:hypothetical protein C2W62_03925 [Candidatus Entotheonella serta]